MPGGGQLRIEVVEFLERVFPAAGGNRHDSIAFESTLDAILSVPGLDGQPRKRPSKLHADKDYDFARCRRYLRLLGIEARIARRGIESRERITALSSRFAAVRMRASHRDYWRSTLRDEEWLLIEWPEGDAEPFKYWLSTMSPDTALERLVHVAKMRWRMERDYRDLKQEFGLEHFEGRGWRGFHHHASLCIAPYRFLVAQRLTQGGSKKLRDP